MRLRQVALASMQLEALARTFSDVLGLRVAHIDPNVAVYGLRNAVLPAGDGFLEIVTPVDSEASAARFLRRRGGDAGYMVILQVADAPTARARAEAMGVRVVEDIERPDYRAVHFHPADFGGVLVSFDEQRGEPDPLAPFGDWMPAGPDWRTARSDEVLALRSVTICTQEPTVLARRWSAFLDRPLDPADSLRLPLDRGEVRFTGAPHASATHVSEVTLGVRDVGALMQRARAAGIAADDERVTIGGVRFRLRA